MCDEPKKIIRFLEELCRALNLKDRIIEDIKKSTLLKELPNSPIAAILLARLFENNSKDLPANLPELYSMYIELVLGKWDIDKGIESIKEYEVVQAVLYRIAYYYIDNNIDYITNTEYEEIINKYIESRNLDIEFDKIDFIITDRSGVLFRDDKISVINYSHRSFIEFMYAKGKAINNELQVTDKVFDISWMNIFYFYIGIKKDCEAFLEEIIKIKPANEPEQWLKIINLSNFYLAARSTPYDFFKNNLYKVFLEAANLYVDITLNKKKSIFSKLPPLIALWWVQLIIKESYGYDFFKKAMVDTAIYIDDLDHNEEIKIYALFFLGTVGIRLGIYEPFNFLLSKYKDKLPSTIAIGIKSEIEFEGIGKKAFSSSKKWLERRTTRMHKQLIKQITEIPIEKLNKE